MGWVWIILGILIVAGSLTWIIPSRRSLVQSKLRMDAKLNGVRVTIDQPPPWLADRLRRKIIPTYRWSYEKGRAGIAIWRLPGQPDNEWICDSKHLNLHKTIIESIKSDSFFIPNEIFGLGFESNSVWLAVDDYHATISFDILKDVVDKLKKKSS